MGLRRTWGARAPQAGSEVNRVGLSVGGSFRWLRPLH